jgi:hypothetical protein
MDGFYDELAPNYHLKCEDPKASMEGQGTFAPPFKVVSGRSSETTNLLHP